MSVTDSTSIFIQNGVVTKDWSKRLFRVKNRRFLWAGAFYQVTSPIGKYLGLVFSNNTIFAFVDDRNDVQELCQVQELFEIMKTAEQQNATDSLHEFSDFAEVSSIEVLTQTLQIEAEQAQTIWNDAQERLKDLAPYWQVNSTPLVNLPDIEVEDGE